MLASSKERKLDISSLIGGETDSIPFSAIFDEAAEQNGISTDAFEIKGRVFGEEKYFSLEGDISCEIKSNCARCLKEVKAPFEFHFELPILSESEDNEDLDDFVPIEDNRIDLFFRRL